MSWQATAWVSTVEAGGPSGKLLLYALANYADENGRCWPSDARLMADTEMAERTIRDWKRKLEDAGLLAVARRRNAGGTYQADEIRLAMTAKKPAEMPVSPPANAAGGDDATTGKSKPDHRHLTTEPPASDCNPPAPPYKAEPSVEPPMEPIEREGGREDENPKEVERWLKRVHPTWPSFVADSGKTAFAAAMALTAAERDTAADRMADYLKAEKTSGGRCAFGVYLSEKRWERLPPKAVEPDKPAYAPAFGPVWAAIRIRDFLTGQKAFPVLKGWETRAIEDGTLNRESAERSARQNSGWPAVNAMHAKAGERGLGLHGHGLEEDRLGKLCEFVPVETPVWHAWKAYHDEQGWPWLPDPGTMRGAYFPAGGPERLSEFEAAVRGNQDDVGGREAAE